MTLSEGVSALATRVAQEINAVRAESGGGGTVAATGSPALGILSATLATAPYGPAAIGIAGDSVAEGWLASDDPRFWVNLLIGRMQAAYPSGLGVETAVQASRTGTFTVHADPGVHGYNVAHAGQNAASYLDADKIAGLAAAALRVVFHAVGTNDYRANRAPATYKADVQTQIDALDAQLAAPVVHVLVHYGEPAHSGTPTYPWTAYGTALAELAAADPDHVAYLDLAPGWSAAVPTFADPLDLYADDNYHPNDRGHAFIADLIWRTLGLPIGGTVAATEPPAETSALTNTTAPAITGTATTGQTLTVSNGTWSATPDSFAYQWKRAGANISGATAATYLLTVDDEGQAITCIVTASKAGYTSGTATSNTVTPAAGTEEPPASGTITETWTGADGDPWPAGWEVNGATATIQAGRGRLDPSSYASAALLTSATGFSGDFDLTVTWQMSGNTSDTSAGIGVGAALASASIRPTSGYTAECAVGTNGELKSVSLYRGGTYLNAAYVSTAPGAGGFTTRVQRVGSTIQAKAWAAGAPEPASWTVTKVDGSPLSGVTYKPFLGAGDQNTGVTITDFDDLAVTAT